jgi:hypothetical protein
MGGTNLMHHRTGLNLLVIWLALGLICESKAESNSAHSTASPAIVYPSAPVSGVTPPGAYAFRDEPVMSVNNSYLGYVNFVDPNAPSPRFMTGHTPRSLYPIQPIRRRSHRWFRQLNGR